MEDLGGKIQACIRLELDTPLGYLLANEKCNVKYLFIFIRA